MTPPVPRVGRHSRQEAAGERGQSTVEFALILPVLVIMLFAVVQVATVMQARVMVTHAAREAARTMSLDPTADVVAAARAAGTFAPDRLTVIASPSRRPGDLVTVEVRYRLALRLPALGVVAEPVVAAEATMLIE